MVQFFTKGILSGFVSGIFLGLFLKVIEVMSGVKVYTLLLNVDYIPILKNYSFPEFVEFLLHLIISVIVAAALFSIIKISMGTKANGVPDDIDLLLNRRPAFPNNSLVRSHP
ncbi:hypothetical protein DFO73_104218 [Cytobacillus oceanisediminis]|uniref:Uncharacterized protein n=1 Tax=Cytobacillus oceanisediminis TaxID=665099 RepID=A0A2V2ZZL4_9BACI|nr:hypothetical protein [Cytobacillus oceanisediminis]PWW29578.1 hypothetical protein DFO73_104218 [Cytobacillus oceanisediminis]